MLEQLKEEFYQLKVVDCGLWHEQVEREANSKKPKFSLFPNEVRYQRKSLCNKQTRDHLGCAHTSLRCRAVQLVEGISSIMVKQLGDDKKLLQELLELPLTYQKEMQRFEADIIKHDIQKSELELAHAEVCEKMAEGESQVLDERLLGIEKKITLLVSHHRVLNAKIRSFHDHTVNTFESIEIRLS